LRESRGVLELPLFFFQVGNFKAAFEILVLFSIETLIKIVNIFLDIDLLNP